MENKEIETHLGHDGNFEETISDIPSSSFSTEATLKKEATDINLSQHGEDSLSFEPIRSEPINILKFTTEKTFQLEGETNSFYSENTDFDDDEISQLPLSDSESEGASTSSPPTDHHSISLILENDEVPFTNSFNAYSYIESFWDHKHFKEVSKLTQGKINAIRKEIKPLLDLNYKFYEALDRLMRKENPPTLITATYYFELPYRNAIKKRKKDSKIPWIIQIDYDIAEGKTPLLKSISRKGERLENIDNLYTKKESSNLSSLFDELEKSLANVSCDPEPLLIEGISVSIIDFAYPVYSPFYWGRSSSENKSSMGAAHSSPLKKAIALYSFEGEGKSELSFAQGDALYLLDEPVDGWVLACPTSNSLKNGFIPEKFIQLDIDNLL